MLKKIIITVDDEIYNKLSQQAEKQLRTLPSYCRYELYKAAGG